MRCRRLRRMATAGSFRAAIPISSPIFVRCASSASRRSISISSGPQPTTWSPRCVLSASACWLGSESMTVGVRRAAAGLVSALAFLMLGSVASVAASPGGPPPIDDLAASIPEMPGKTWLDLLRQLFPDITEAQTVSIGATASAIIPLRSIGAADEGWLQCDGGIKIRNLDARPAQLAGRRYLVVTVEIPNDCAGLLALFDETGKLVDAVNVKGDQHVSFSGEYVRPLGTGGALVIPQTGTTIRTRATTSRC